MSSSIDKNPWHTLQQLDLEKIKDYGRTPHQSDALILSEQEYNNLRNSKAFKAFLASVKKREKVYKRLAKGGDTGF